MSTACTQKVVFSFLSTLLLCVASVQAESNQAEWLSGSERHAGPVTALQFHPKSPQLLSTSTDGSVRSWNFQSSEDARRLVRFRKAVRDFSVSPDGEWLVLAGDKAEVAIHRAMSGSPDDSLVGVHGSQLAVEISPDGRYIAVGGEDSKLTIWKRGDAEPLHRFGAHDAPLTALSFSPDGRFVATAGENGSLRVWEVLSGYLVFSVKLDGPLHDVAFSPDGQKLAVAARDVKILEVKSNSVLRSLDFRQGNVWSVAWSPNGKWLAIGSSDRATRLVALSSGRVLQRFDTQDGHITALAFSPDGQLLATGSSHFERDGRLIGQNSVAVWDLKKLYPDDRLASFVESEVYKWQQRGEFEKQEAYEDRVGSLPAVAGKLFAKAFRTHRDLVKENAVLSNYNADREEYEVTLPTLGSFKIRVPIHKAATFKRRFDEMVYRNFIVETELQVPNQSRFEIKRVELYLPSAKQSFIYDASESAAK